jgi:hypothetical protein
MHLIHIPQAFSIWLFLWAMQNRNPEEIAPLEGAATLPPFPRIPPEDLKDLQ